MKMYVLVLKSLSKSQQAVQAGHALAQYLIELYERDELDEFHWNNSDLVYLKATWAQLMTFTSDLNNKAIPYYEPDLNGQITAIAMLGGDNDPRFIDFRLV